MKKTVVLSTDDNQNYILYLPYIQKAWNLLGWNTLTFYLGKEEIDSNTINSIIKINPIKGYRDCTIVQTIRLLASNYIDEGIIMTSDIDMMPLSNYWNPKYDEITCYGYDLTNFSQFPICYIAANSDNWKKLISCDSLENLLSLYPYGISNVFDEWWFTDQLIITDKLLKIKNELTIINRSKINNLAFGRIDRVAWNMTRFNNIPKIDAHMPRPFSEESCIDLINNVLLKNINNHDRIY